MFHGMIVFGHHKKSNYDKKNGDSDGNNGNSKGKGKTRPGQLFETQILLFGGSITNFVDSFELIAIEYIVDYFNINNNNNNNNKNNSADLSSMIIEVTNTKCINVYTKFDYARLLKFPIINHISNELKDNLGCKLNDKYQFSRFGFEFIKNRYLIIIGGRIWKNKQVRGLNSNRIFMIDLKNDFSYNTNKYNILNTNMNNSSIKNNDNNNVRKRKLTANITLSRNNSNKNSQKNASKIENKNLQSQLKQLNINASKQRISTAFRLPYAVAGVSAIVHFDHLHIIGGYDNALSKCNNHWSIDFDSILAPFAQNYVVCKPQLSVNNSDNINTINNITTRLSSIATANGDAITRKDINQLWSSNDKNIAIDNYKQASDGKYYKSGLWSQPTIATTRAKVERRSTWGGQNNHHHDFDSKSMQL